jgi:hypothetical protein
MPDMVRFLQFRERTSYNEDKKFEIGDRKFLVVGKVQKNEK